MSGTRLAIGVALAAALCACGAPPPAPAHTGGREEPSSPTEQQILERLDDWTGDQTIGGLRVHAEPSYHAASGATCRWLTLGSSGSATRRLACKNEPSAVGGWYYAPDVLVAPAAMP